MKNFLYLRILAITTCLILVACMIMILTNWKQYLHGGTLNVLIINETILSLMAAHSVIILFIYYRYFPDKEIPKSMHVCYKVSRVVGWICVVFLLVAMVTVLVFSGEDLETEPEGYLTIYLCTTLSTLMMVQLFGGARLVKAIRKNARRQLENSFA